MSFVIEANLFIAGHSTGIIYDLVDDDLKLFGRVTYDDRDIHHGDAYIAEVKFDLDLNTRSEVFWRISDDESVAYLDTMFNAPEVATWMIRKLHHYLAREGHVFNTVQVIGASLYHGAPRFDVMMIGNHHSAEQLWTNLCANGFKTTVCRLIYTHVSQPNVEYITGLLKKNY